MNAWQLKKCKMRQTTKFNRTEFMRLKTFSIANACKTNMKRLSHRTYPKQMNKQATASETIYILSLNKLFVILV